MITIFGLLALAAFFFSLAANTCTLWKIGLLFLVDWMLITLINFNIQHPIDAILFSAIYFISSIFCRKLYVKYSCATSNTVSMLFILSSISAIYYLITNDYAHSVLVFNVFFIAQAVIIVFSSINRMMSKNRRHVEIGPRGSERRGNPFKKHFTQEGGGLC